MSENTKQTAGLFMAAQETSNGIIVKFYGDHPKLEYPVVKLYDTDLMEPSEDLKELPDWLLKKIQAKGMDTSTMGDLKRDVAVSKGLTFNLEPTVDFYVYVNDGKTSKRVDWKATKDAWAGTSPQAGQASTASGEPLVYKGITEDTLPLIQNVSDESFLLARVTMTETVSLLDELAEEEWLPEGIDVMEVWKTLFYRNSKVFDSVRGARVIGASDAVEDPFDKIKEGTIDTFADDLAGGHMSIADENTARDLIDLLDIKITKVHVDDVEERVKVARQVWLYCDLTNKYGMAASEAKTLIDSAYNEIPW